MKKFFVKVLFLGAFLILFIPATAAEISQGLLYPKYSKTISMDFQDANMKDILKIFSQQSGLNFIASDEVKDRTVTVFLENVPVEEALDRLLIANNLTYEIQEGSNIFIVKELTSGLKTMTKIFFLRYTSVSNSRIKSEVSDGLVRKAEFEGGGEGGGGGGAGGGGGGGEGGGGGKAEATGIKQIVENVLTDLGKVIEDSRTNSLIVTDKPEQFPVIEKTIASLDVSTPQVIIEVEMLDVSKGLVDKLGVLFGESWMSLRGDAKTIEFPLNDIEALGTRTFTMGSLSFANLTATLNFLTTDTDTKYLARPRILTVSNETAEIKIVTDEAIGLKQSSSGEGAAAITTQEAERAETGVALRVTPQVNLETGEITMFVEPSVSEASQSNLSTSFRDPERRQAKSVLRIKDGETIVIGGLIRNRFTEAITKVPILGDIPILGAAFRHRNKSKDEDRELMIFLTPRIVREQKLSRASSQANSLPPFSREQELPKAKMTEVERALSKFENK